MDCPSDLEEGLLSLPLPSLLAHLPGPSPTLNLFLSHAPWSVVPAYSFASDHMWRLVFCPGPAWQWAKSQRVGMKEYHLQPELCSVAFPMPLHPASGRPEVVGGG